jgi:hemolysin III
MGVREPRPATRRGAMAALRPSREDITSAAIQGTTAALSAAGLVLLVHRAGAQSGALPVIGAAVYGASLIVAFLASALYHGVLQPRVKRIFRALDHCTIFVLIAGTYTPIALLALWHHEGWLLLASIWTLAILGIALRLAHGPRFHRLAIPLYVAMGWLGVAWSGPLYDAIGLGPILLIVAGGVAYTGGLAFYRWTRLPFSNVLWHLCVVAGTACFFLAIALFVFPDAA